MNSNIENERDSAEMQPLVDSGSIESVKNTGVILEKSEWLTTKEAAIYLRKFSSYGSPSENAVHKLVSNGSIRRRKFAGRLFFRRRELDFLIESSVM